MELSRPKHVHQRLDNTRSRGPQDQQADGERRRVEALSEQVRHGRQGDQQQSGQVKEAATGQNGPIVTEDLFEDHPHERGRVGHRHRDGHVGRSRNGLHAGIPVHIVHSLRTRLFLKQAHIHVRINIVLSSSRHMTTRTVK